MLKILLNQGGNLWTLGTWGQMLLLWSLSLVRTSAVSLGLCSVGVRSITPQLKPYMSPDTAKWPLGDKIEAYCLKPPSLFLLYSLPWEITMQKNQVDG